MPRISKVYKIERELFLELVYSCNNIKEILTKLGLEPSSSNYKILYRRFKEENIPTDKYKEQNKQKSKSFLTGVNQRNEIPFEEILVSDSPYKSTSTLKRKLLRHDFFKNVCYECGMESQYL